MEKAILELIFLRFRKREKFRNQFPIQEIKILVKILILITIWKQNDLLQCDNGPSGIAFFGQTWIAFGPNMIHWFDSFWAYFLNTRVSSNGKIFWQQSVEILAASFLLFYDHFMIVWQSVWFIEKVTFLKQNEKTKKTENLF